MAGSGTSGLFGAAEQIAVERGLAEFRSGRPVIVTSAEEMVTVLPVDGMTDEALVSFRGLCLPARPHLLITARRARALGLEGAGPTGLPVGDLYDRAAIFSLAADAQVTRRPQSNSPSSRGCSRRCSLASMRAGRRPQARRRS
jgi:GTP cyclohydrolase II